MNYIKPLFRIDRRPIVKINCANILNDTNSDLRNLPCPDFNNDGIVDSKDLGILTANIGTRNSLYDLNGDGIIDVSDTNLLISYFGPLNCAQWSGSAYSNVCNSARMSRGVAALCQPNGFYNFFNIKLQRLYDAGVRRFVLQCPSGTFSNTILSSNIRDPFDASGAYSVLTSQTKEVLNCNEPGIPFDKSNNISGGYFESFRGLMREWVGSLGENVEIFIEINSSVLMLGAEVDYSNIMLRADLGDSHFYESFDPDNIKHVEWLIYNTQEMDTDGLSGIALNNFGAKSLGRFDGYKNINHFMSSAFNGQEVMCTNLPNINGNLYNFEEYSKCKFVFDQDNFNWATPNKMGNARLFQYNTEIHAIASANMSKSESDFYDLAYNYGCVPGLKLTYNDDIDVSSVSSAISRMKNAIESAERKISLGQSGRKFYLFSEHAGNTADSNNAVSSKNNYLRSDSAKAKDTIVPVVKTNCSINISNLPIDIARTYIPAWWFTNDRQRCIDSSMLNFVSDSWTVPNSSSILNASVPSPYGTIGPEKCADAVFDQNIYYQIFYNGTSAAKIDFKQSKNFIVKLENWGDLHDHIYSDSPFEGTTLDQNGWCRLFTHGADKVRPYRDNDLNLDYNPIDPAKNLFAYNGSQECAMWVKRFIARFKWRQGYLASYDADYVVPSPSLIYIDEQTTIQVSDFINYKNVNTGLMSRKYFGSWFNHFNDPRYSLQTIGFKWRDSVSLSDAFFAATSQYSNEFSVIRTDGNSQSTFGKILPSDYKPTSNQVTYDNQSNASMEKWLQILIDEVVARRVYESFGVQVEKAFSNGRYSQKGFVGYVPSSDLYGNIHAPFYPLINRWQNYNGKYGFNDVKSSSFLVSYIHPVSVIASKFASTKLGWSPSILNSDINIRFEILDYYSSAFSGDLQNSQWGWPIFYNNDPDGRGSYIYGTGNSDFATGYSIGDAHQRSLRTNLIYNHKKYINYLLNTIDSLDSNSTFYNNLKVIFTHGVNIGNIKNIVLPKTVSNIGDLSTGSILSSDSDGYTFDQKTFSASYSEYAKKVVNSSIPEKNVVFIHSHPNHSISDWNELIYGIDQAISLPFALRSSVNPNQTDAGGGLSTDDDSGSSGSSSSSRLLGDINGDGIVNSQDLGELLGSWGPCLGCPADLDGDGVVGSADLGLLLGNWTVAAQSSSSSLTSQSSSSSLASQSSSSSSVGLFGDITGDGVVNGADLGALLGRWGESDLGNVADLTGDGTVDGADLGSLLGAWTVTSQPSSSSPTSQSSSSSNSPSSSSSSRLLGDINGDGVVDGADLGILLGSWGVCVGCPADLDRDGVVTGADLGLLLGNWTAGSSTSSPCGMGDWDCDGRISDVDFAAFLDCFQSPQGNCLPKFDFNGDGRIDFADAQRMREMYCQDNNCFGSSSGSSGSSSSSSVDLAVYTSVILIRLEPSIIIPLNLTTIEGWRLAIVEDSGQRKLRCYLISSTGLLFSIIFDIILNNKFVSDLAKEINSINGVYAQVISGSYLASSEGLAIQENQTYLANESATLYLDDPIVNFVGFDNPFSIISIDSTVNSYELIGSSIKHNFGQYNSYSSIVASALLTSTIGGSSSYLTVNDPAGIMNQFKRVSIDGELIDINSWSGNTAEIGQRGVEGTAKRFHALNAKVFGMTGQDLFDDNFYIDPSSDFLYQYRCVGIRNIYKDVSIDDPQIVVDSSVGQYLYKLSFAFEVPANKYIKLSGPLGSGNQSIDISSENILSYILDGRLESLVGTIVKFTESSGAVAYRVIDSVTFQFVNLDQPLSKSVNQYEIIEILPGPASSSYQGKIRPQFSNRITSFVNSENLSDLTLSRLSDNMSRVISYNDLIYLWIKREVPKNARIAFESALPFKIKFKIK